MTTFFNQIVPRLSRSLNREAAPAATATEGEGVCALQRFDLSIEGVEPPHAQDRPAPQIQQPKSFDKMSQHSPPDKENYSRTSRSIPLICCISTEFGHPEFAH